MASGDRIGPTASRIVLPTEQRHMGAPVVHAPGLPSMEGVGAVKTVLRNAALPLMGAGVTIGTRNEGVMEEWHSMTALPPRPAMGPQMPKEAKAAPAAEEAYVRLELQFANGRLSIIGLKEVPGPLAAPSAVIQGHVYEVLIGDQQIALGSIPDVGVRRAFANRDVPDPQGKHRFIHETSFEFFARIPKVHATTENLPKMTVVLHNVREAPDRLVPATAVQQQPGVDAVEVARLSGIILAQVPAAVRVQLERIVSDNKTPQ
jgi:hypothetical protein